jgi:hypothetical protein
MTNENTSYVDMLRKFGRPKMAEVGVSGVGYQGYGAHQDRGQLVG